jgi:hypothetical protein
MRKDMEVPIKSGRLWFYRIAALGFGTILALVCLEGLLQISPGVLPRKLQNVVFSRYGTLPGDLYFREPISSVLFMFRDDEVRAFFNGYWWEHRTDHFGFRNPDDLKRREILLVGDSILYGHGVEDEYSIAHMLRTRYGYAAYSLSRQGACLNDHYVNLRLFMEDLDPQIVILFFFINDYFELESRHDVLCDIPELRYDYQQIRSNVDALGVRREGVFARMGSRLAIVRFAHRLVEERWHLRQLILWISMWGKGESRKNPDKLGLSGPILVPERLQAIHRYYERILLDLKNECNKLGIELIFINLRIRESEDVQRNQALARAQEFLCDIARNLDVPFFDTLELFRDCTVCVLPHDGHLNQEGHARLAEFLSKEVLSSRTSAEEGIDSKIGRDITLH